MRLERILSIDLQGGSRCGGDRRRSSRPSQCSPVQCPRRDEPPRREEVRGREEPLRPAPRPPITPSTLASPRPVRPPEPPPESSPPPPRPAVSTRRTLQDEAPKGFRDSPVIKAVPYASIFFDDLAIGVPTPRTPHFAELAQMVAKAYDRISANGDAPDAVMPDLADNIDNLMQG